MKSVVAPLLALLLPIATLGQQAPFSPLPVPADSSQEAAGSPAQEPAAKPELPARVDPGLVKKKVVVYFRDGRVYKGKLVELTDDFLRLKMNGRTERIALTEVARVDRQPRNWLAVAIVAAVAGPVLVLYAIIIAD